MGLFTYTLDTPSEDHVENVRLGYRTPRTVLLPPYLYTNPYFLQYAEAIDTVFGPLVDEKIEILKNLRNMWPTDPALEEAIYNNAVTDEPVMLDDSQWPSYERQLVVQQVNTLGMNLQSAGLLTDKQYQQISRWVGKYWFGKGTQSFIDFMNYCLGTSLTVIKLWTEDYVTFLPEGDGGIGTPIWENGTWYPTTHVQIEVAGGNLASVSVQDLITFFYEIANYNLVLKAVDFRFNLNIVDTPNVGETSASIVAIGLWANNVIVMSNFARYGASAPPVQQTDPDVSVSALVPQGSTGLYLLASPSSWMMINGLTIPVYAATEQTPVDGPEIATSVMGPGAALPAGEYQLLCGPVEFLEVPNSSRTTARIPGYATAPIPKATNLGQVPTLMLGTSRDYILANPDGFADVTGTGYLTPYWITS